MVYENINITEHFRRGDFIMLNIVICEDDLPQRLLLYNYLDKILNDICLDYDILEFSSAEELLTNYPRKLDILFLDIQMGDLSGMDVARKIRNFDSRVEIIFTTAIAEYIYEGYEVRAYRCATCC